MQYHVIFHAYWYENDFPEYGCLLLCCWLHRRLALGTFRRGSTGLRGVIGVQKPAEQNASCIAPQQLITLNLFETTLTMGVGSPAPWGPFSSPLWPRYETSHFWELPEFTVIIVVFKNILTVPFVFKQNSLYRNPNLSLLKNKQNDRLLPSSTGNNGRLGGEKQPWKRAPPWPVPSLQEREEWKKTG